MEGRYASAHEAVSMENPKHTAAQSVKSEHRLVFGGLGTGLNMTKTYWVVKTLFHSLLLLHCRAGIENLNNSSSTKKHPLFSSQALTWLYVSSGRLRGAPFQTCWTQSMELRWTIGGRSRKLCWGNVCLRDWTLPWVYVNWAPCNHTQAPYDQCLQAWARWSRLSSLLDVSFWGCNRNGFLSSSFTFWRTPRDLCLTQGRGFIRNAWMAFMNSGSVAVGMPMSVGCSWIKYFNKCMVGLHSMSWSPEE